MKASLLLAIENGHVIKGINGVRLPLPVAASLVVIEAMLSGDSKDG